MEPKAQTYQQKLGFFDTDLKKPKHDEIMFWLEKKAYDVTMQCAEEQIPFYNKGDLRRNAEIVNFYSQWEYPIKNINLKTGGVFLIGYIDYRTTIEIVYQGRMVDRMERTYTDWEEYNKILELCFEVKTEIRSVGELLRQINTYREYVRPKRFYVVCPDNKHAEFLKTQGVDFIKYE